jgi:hypothetical protein
VDSHLVTSYRLRLIAIQLVARCKQELVLEANFTGLEAIRLDLNYLLLRNQKAVDDTIGFNRFERCGW